MARMDVYVGDNVWRKSSADDGDRDRDDYWGQTSDD